MQHALKREAHKSSQSCTVLYMASTASKLMPAEAGTTCRAAISEGTRLARSYSPGSHAPAACLHYQAMFGYGCL